MTPIVLVHGFMGGSGQWGPLSAYLSETRGISEVIAVDLPGFGARADEAPLRSIAAYAEWVIGHLHQRGIGRYHLLGHSMGGMVAQEIARRDVDRVVRLVLYSTGAVGVLPGRFETISESKRRAAEEGAEPTARRIAATWFLQGEEAPGYAITADIAARTQLAALQAGLDAMNDWDGQEGLGDIRQDTLVIWGDRDRTYPWSQTEQLWRGIANCAICVLPGVAHAIHGEGPEANPELLQRAIAAFLTR